MIGSLTGTVAAHFDQRCLIQVAGVGYWVHTGTWHPEGTVTCFIHHHVREDSSDLYGFLDLPTLKVFELLIGVNGVGPKVALALLSLGNAERLAQAIQQEDIAFLSLAPGVGPKAAQRIVIDLKNKVSTGEGPASTPLHTDIIEALVALGYRTGDIRPHLAAIPAEHTSLDTQIKWVLQQMNR